MNGIFLWIILTDMKGDFESYEFSQTSEFAEQNIDLFQEVDRLTRRATIFDINVQGIIRYGKGTKELFPDHALFEASLGNVPLTHMVIDRFYAQDIFPIKPELIAKSGSGIFDGHADRPQATAEELLEDMLKRSGNTAFNVFSEALGGADEINSFYKDRGWARTKVGETLNGKVEVGSTTPREALEQFQGLLELSDDNPLVETVQNSLRDYTSARYGIRQRVQPSNDLVIYNITGEYNGDHHAHNPVPYSVRHDVGAIEGENGIILYALMTSTTKNMFKTKIASEILGQFGAEFASVVGGKSTKWLGSLALRARN